MELGFPEMPSGFPSRRRTPHPTRKAMLRGAVRIVALVLVLMATPMMLVARVGESRSFALGDVPQAEDVNPDPRVVEVNLDAHEATVELVPGKQTRVWTYNGTVPAPMIVANLGDEVIVHLRNRLPQPITIHWHGLEVPAVMDGSHISAPHVPPGGSFTFRFRPLTAATYWYHSHMNAAEQVERGLYGGFVVRNDEKDANLGLPEDERMLVLDDVLLDDNGQMPGFATDRASNMTPEQRALHMADGREGNHLLVNGAEVPMLEVTGGKPERWRIVNVSNGRFMRLSIPGQVMYRIGGDAGLIGRPERVRNVSMFPDPADPKRRISEPDPTTGLLLVPGERAEIVITPRGAVGDEITVEQHDFPRGRHQVLPGEGGGLAYGHNFNDGKADPQPLMRLRITGTTEQYREYVPPDPLRPVPRLSVDGAEVIQIPFGHEEPEPDGSAVFWAAQRDGLPVPFGEMTSDDAPDVELGKNYILEVANLTKMDHPVHVHGFFFQPLETEYVDPSNPANNRVVPFLGRENKDVIRLPAAPGAHEGAGGKAILRLVVRFDDEGRKGKVEAFGKDPEKRRSGGWMIHCHNQEHSDAGMMTFLELREKR
jgi:FtsP/CotA-like multicopper oxidase with cupredoxin domain